MTGAKTRIARGRLRLLRAACLVLAVGTLAGCADDIQTGYGQRRGAGYSGSVNGTAVLSHMFIEAGHEVTSWRWLSPRLDRRADVIVWFPDDVGAPREEAVDWLEEWLATDDRRTLVYVSRDFDAAPRYWKKIESRVSSDKLGEVKRRRAAEASRFRQQQGWTTGGDECEWFEFDRRRRPLIVNSLSGAPEWVEGVDAKATEIELSGRMNPADDFEPLLASGNDALVSYRPPTVYSGQVILVVNGSFLLNLPLVNHEHRKLAASLIDEVGPPGNVVFLESGFRGPPVLEKDPAGQLPSGLAVFSVEPLATLLLHAAVLGMIFVFARLPIFGRAADPEATALVVTQYGMSKRVGASNVDFGHHVTALGELLERTRDHRFASSRVAHYRQLVRHEPVAGKGS